MSRRRHSRLVWESAWDSHPVWQPDQTRFLQALEHDLAIASPVLDFEPDPWPNWQPKALYRQGVRIGLEPSPPHRWLIIRTSRNGTNLWCLAAEPWKGAPLFQVSETGSPFREAAGTLTQTEGPLAITWTALPPGVTALKLERVLPSRPDLTGYWYQAAGWTDGTPSSGRLWRFSTVVSRLFDPIPEIVYVSTGNGRPVEIFEADGALILRPVGGTLEDLLDRVTPENLHAEELVDRPQGREAW